MNIEKYDDELMSLPNVVNRIGEWKDVNDAFEKLRKAYFDMKTDEIKLAYLNPPIMAELFLIDDLD